MPRNNPIQTSWTKGEVSPLAAGRVDVNLYGMGAKTIENLIVRPQGPVFRRSGTKFVRSTKFNTQKARIIPFTVSDETAYELEFGAGYIHFYKNKEPLFETTTTEVESFLVANSGGLFQIQATFDDLPGWGDVNTYTTSADNGTAVQSAGAAGTVRITTSVPHTLRTGALVYMRSTADPNSINAVQFSVNRISAYAIDLVGSTYVSVAGITDTAMFSHGLLAGDRVFISGATNYPELSEQFHTVKQVTEYGFFDIANVAYVNHGVPTGEEAHTIPIEVVTTFTEDELVDIHYVQSADVLYLFHPDHKPQKLVRLDDDGDRNDWLLADVDFKDGPYLDFNDLSPNIDTTTPANGAIYSDVYFEVSGYSHTANVTAAAAFGASDDGRYLEYREGDQWKLASLTSGQGTSSGVISIVDNVLLRLDEAVRIQVKKDKPVFVPGSSGNSPVYSGNMGNTSRNRARAAQRIDPNNALASDQTTTVAPTTASALAAGTIKSQFSNTFGQSDVGKYVRVPSDATAPTAATGPVPYWVQILKVDSGTNAGSSAKHSVSVQFVANYTTGNFVISGETRTATINAYRAGSTFAAFTLVTDVGRLIRLGFAGRWTWAKILTVASTSQVTVQLYEDMPRDPSNAANIAGALNPALTYSGGFVTGATTGRTYDWRVGAWSATTGYPAVGVFHEQRLWLANTATTPSTVWGSVSGDFENFLPTELDSTVLDDNAVTVTLGSTRANAIKWLVSGPAMTIGTSGGEWQMRANSSINEAITPANVKATEYTSHGSKADTLPARVGSAILFVDRSGEKVYKVFYSYEKDALDSDDLTVISEHIIRTHGGAVASAFQQKPHSIFWVVCADGTLSGMTYNEKQEVVAWHHHTLAGDGIVEDISVIPSADGSEDELWMVVKRTINGSTVRYIEVLETDYYPASSTDRSAMKFLDSHQYISGFTGTVITGLDHLEAATVVVVKDGVRISGTFTVSGGSITLASGATTELLIGLNGNADLVSLPPEGGSQFGTSQGQLKKLISLDGRFYNTSRLTVGRSFTAAEMVTVTLPVTSPDVWFSKTSRMLSPHNWDIESAWYIRQDEPYPLNILFIVSKLETNE